jgi:hypothetical protein
VLHALEAIKSDWGRTFLTGAALAGIVWLVTQVSRVDLIASKIDDLRTVVELHNQTMDDQVGRITNDQSAMKQLEARLEQRMDDTDLRAASRPGYRPEPPPSPSFTFPNPLRPIGDALSHFPAPARGSRARR